MKKANNNLGITLIALVVTIVILLLLAGVSFRLITGEDGVLKQTLEAVDENEAATADEEIKLKTAEAVMKYYADFKTNKSKTLLTFMDEYLTANATTPSGAKLSKNENGVWVYTDLNGNKTTFGITEDGDPILGATEPPTGGDSEEETPLPTKKTLVEQVTANNYGDKVNYSVTVNNVELKDWKIFYKTGNQVMMIMSDYLPNTTNLAQKAGLTQGTQGFFKDYGVRCTTSKDGFMQILNNSVNWQELVTEELGRKNVIAKGAASVQDWINSWNEKGFVPNLEMPGKYPNDISYRTYSSLNTNNTGYELYIPRSKTGQPFYAYLLSSSSEYGTIAVTSEESGELAGSSSKYGEGYTGSSDEYVYSCYVLRPIIILTDSVVGEYKNGAWNIE